MSTRSCSRSRESKASKPAPARQSTPRRPCYARSGPGGTRRGARKLGGLYCCGPARIRTVEEVPQLTRTDPTKPTIRQRYVKRAASLKNEAEFLAALELARVSWNNRWPQFALHSPSFPEDLEH